MGRGRESSAASLLPWHTASGTWGYIVHFGGIRAQFWLVSWLWVVGQQRRLRCERSGYIAKDAFMLVGVRLARAVALWLCKDGFETTSMTELPCFPDAQTANQRQFPTIFQLAASHSCLAVWPGEISHARLLQHVALPVYQEF
ncbi:hypothetical protein QBC38DRAFT_540601 [Podospora fimiseda]|uniref:Uncharacterized protein n=1 Tax=Podospora fimiseda TaxID=252190 RepID=A0AAN7BZF3_9PEZI|nr:hypothetical protein QBC38DRAFT_540601 [Podospora fimiseda]